MGDIHRETVGGYVRRQVRGHKVVAGILGFALFASAGALAAWLIQTDGSGNGQAATLQAPTNIALTTAEKDAIVGDLVPGGTGSLYIAADNPNSVDLYITDLTGPATVTSNDQTNCPASNVSFVPQTGIRVGPFTAGARTVIQVPDALAMAANAADGCQGIRFLATLNNAGQAITWST